MFTTPVRAQPPGAEAAVRLADTVDGTCGLEVDSEHPVSFATETREQYEALVERIEEWKPDGAYDRAYR